MSTLHCAGLTVHEQLYSPRSRARVQDAVQRKTAELAALREGGKSEAEFARQAVQEAGARASAAEAAAEQLQGAAAKLRQQLERAREEAAAAQESAEAGYVLACTDKL